LGTLFAVSHDKWAASRDDVHAGTNIVPAALPSQGVAGVGFRDWGLANMRDLHVLWAGAGCDTANRGLA
jgi:hypothetical protein